LQYRTYITTLQYRLNITTSQYLSDCKARSVKPHCKLCFVTEVTCQSETDIFQLLEPLFRKVRIYSTCSLQANFDTFTIQNVYHHESRHDVFKGSQPVFHDGRLSYKVTFDRLFNTKISAVFWDIAPCSPYVNRRFGGTYGLHLQGRKSAEQETSV
jgi:hypothetical protein